MRVVARVEEMVVQRPVEPVVQELNRPYVKQHGDDGSISSPHWHETGIRDGCVDQVEHQPIEDDLIIPVQNGKDHLTFTRTDVLVVDTVLSNVMTIRFQICACACATDVDRCA